MHDDEQRDEGELDDLVFAEFADDHDSLREYFERLRRGTPPDPSTDVASVEAARLRRTNQELIRRLGSANAALDAYRAESVRLKGDLKRLRSSRSYRLGRTLAKPGSWLRPQDAPALVAHPSTAEPEVRLRDLSYEEILRSFQDAPDATRLGHVLSRAWYEKGHITDAVTFLQEHPDAAAELNPSHAVLARRILGVERVRAGALLVPPRTTSPAYVAEPGRVMYCAHSTPAFDNNGYSTRTRGLVTGLRESGVDVVVVGRSGYPWDGPAPGKPALRRHVVRLDGVPYVHLPGPSLAREPLDHYVLECADAFVREARLRRPSVIHAASNFTVGLAALIAARRLGVPFVYEVRGLWEVTEASSKPGWEHTERYALQASLEALVASSADAVLAITAQTRDELVRRGVPAGLVSLAPNAVDTDEFLPLPRDLAYAAELGVRTDVPVIGFAGSLVPYEGLDLLVEAAGTLRDAGIETQVVIAGSGPVADDLERRARGLDLGTDRVLMLGRLPAQDVPRLLSLFDIMPCPRLSLPVTEMVSPLKPLESMGTGKAVVLSDVAPHRDLAGPNASRARLFPAGDADALAATLRELVLNPDAVADLGRTGRLWCLDERSWSAVADAIATVHNAAAARHRAETDTVPLRELRVGLIADEFTTETVRPAVRLVPLSRDNWAEDLKAVDLVLVESAWKGNGGQWHRGVGRYSDEEHSDIASLLARARSLGIPSVFWNKEDPVHFARFVDTAVLCDHIFTTDATKIPDYLGKGVGTVRSVASLPFFAQPRLHNPLPSTRPYERTASYAGTYYGSRYPERSAALTALLEAARPFGLTIYDRQADDPESPYHFPSTLTPHVRGALPYTEVVQSYSAHLACLNVNSVTDSPSMFSRRVVEVAACGGVVLSGPGRGIEETFGSVIPTSEDPLVWRALLRHWATSPSARLRESWRQLRAVQRAHTADSALTIVARSAGLAVESPPRPAYAVLTASTDPVVYASLAAQSVRPAAVVCAGPEAYSAASPVLSPAGVRVVETTSTGDRLPVDLNAEWFLLVDTTLQLHRTAIEDLLIATTFGDWDFIRPEPVTDPEPGASLAAPTSRSGPGALVHSSVVERIGLTAALASDGLHGVQLLMPSEVTRRGEPLPGATVGVDLNGARVLVAGHDLKFATALLDALRGAGAIVTVDQWRSHTDHDEDQSRALLADADIVFCEWGLGNAVWYSEHVRPHQRLVVRVHLQELQRPYLERTIHENVDAYIFVGELILRAAVTSHGVPRSRAMVVPNYVRVDDLDRPKSLDAARTLGIVGVVPQRKRLDLALDVLEQLREGGEDYCLRVKGKMPHEYPWMRERSAEKDWFDRQFERIERINAAHPNTVVMDGHGDDMASWYARVGVVLSVSDFESFHLTIPDGAASGAVPGVLAWAGADLIYPRDWLSPTIPALVERIRTAPRDPSAYRDVVHEHFDARLVIPRLLEVIAGPSRQP